MGDYLVKATAFSGAVRAYAARTTDLVEEARRRQDTWPTASAALGRTLTISVMMGAMLKGDDTLTVKVEGDGPLGAIVTDANSRGEVRGYVTNPHTNLAPNAQGKLDVSGAVGAGSLSIVKDLGLKDYFTGSVPIVSGEISEDFTYYFATSEQTPSAVGAGVLVNPDNTILASGGFIVQVMPGATDEVIDALEKNIADFPPISKLVEEGYTPEQLLNRLFGQDNKPNLLEELPLSFTCQCSRERVETTLISLGGEEIESMIEEDKGAEVTCHFCSETYEFSEDDLHEIKKECSQ